MRKHCYFPKFQMDKLLKVRGLKKNRRLNYTLGMADASKYSFFYC